MGFGYASGVEVAKAIRVPNAMAASTDSPLLPCPFRNRNYRPQPRDRSNQSFRSSFRDWAAEETDHPQEVIEAVPAHEVRNRVEAAYARSGLFDQTGHVLSNRGLHFHYVIEKG